MKYVPSAFVGRLSRSAGSTTAGHNRFGAYLRNRVIPTNPSSEAQSVVRNNLSDLSGSWRGLTEEQRSGWTALGASITRTDTLGETYNLTGQLAFVSLNRNRFTFGNAQLDDPPLLQLPIALVSSVLTALRDDPDPISMVLNWTATPLAGNTKMLIYATRPLSAGINFQPRGAYKLIQVTAAAQASGIGIETNYLALFGDPPLGSKILYYLIVVNENGFAQTPFHGSAIVASV